MKRPYRARLEACGQDWKDVEETAALVGEYSEAEALWRLARENVAKERIKLDEYVGKCRRFRNSVVRQLRVVRETSETALPVPHFKKNGSRAEMVQDLHDLYALCRVYSEHKEVKKAVDPLLGQKACDMSQTLSMMHVSVVLQRDAAEKLKCKRNALCNRMYLLIQNSCAVGRQVLRNDLRKKDYFCGKQHFTF
jgi:hypothetical protein